MENDNIKILALSNFRNFGLQRNFAIDSPCSTAQEGVCSGINNYRNFYRNDYKSDWKVRSKPLSLALSIVAFVSVNMMVRLRIHSRFVGTAVSQSSASLARPLTLVSRTKPVTR